MQPASNIIELKNLSKSFSAHSVFKNLTATITTNQTSLLLGANGSGKSTLLGLIAGVLAADSGHIIIPNGLKLAYLSQDLLLYNYLTVSENLQLYAKLCDSSSLEEEIKYWQLTPYLNNLLSTLSKGWQQRVNLCRLFLQPSNYLLLDEPTTHLDACGIELLKLKLHSVIQNQQHLGMLISTHDLYNLNEQTTNTILIHSQQILHYQLADKDLALNLYREHNR